MSRQDPRYVTTTQTPGPGPYDMAPTVDQKSQRALSRQEQETSVGPGGPPQATAPLVGLAQNPAQLQFPVRSEGKGSAAAPGQRSLTQDFPTTTKETQGTFLPPRTKLNADDPIIEEAKKVAAKYAETAKSEFERKAPTLPFGKQPMRPPDLPVTKDNRKLRVVDTKNSRHKDAKKSQRFPLHMPGQKIVLYGLAHRRQRPRSNHPAFIVFGIFEDKDKAAEHVHTKLTAYKNCSFFYTQVMFTTVICVNMHTMAKQHVVDARWLRLYELHKQAQAQAERDFQRGVSQQADGQPCRSVYSLIRKKQEILRRREERKKRTQEALKDLPVGKGRGKKARELRRERRKAFEKAKSEADKVVVEEQRAKEREAVLKAQGTADHEDDEVEDYGEETAIDEVALPEPTGAPTTATTKPEPVAEPVAEPVTTKPTETTPAYDPVEESRVQDTLGVLPAEATVINQRFVVVSIMLDIRKAVIEGHKESEPGLVFLAAFNNRTDAEDYATNTARPAFPKAGLDVVDMYQWLFPENIDPDELKEEYTNPELNEIMQGRKDEIRDVADYKEFCKERGKTAPVIDIKEPSESSTMAVNVTFGKGADEVKEVRNAATLKAEIFGLDDDLASLVPDEARAKRSPEEVEADMELPQPAESEKVDLESLGQR